MSEPDHIFLIPYQNPMIGDKPAAFPFFYIEPSKKEFVPVTQRFIGFDKTRKDCEQIAPIGSSPTFTTFDDLKVISPAWVNTSIAIFEDPVSNKARYRDPVMRKRRELDVFGMPLESVKLFSIVRKCGTRNI